MRFKILAIEDDLFEQHRLAAILEPAGFELSYAEAGVEGLALACSIQPDLLILDIILPDTGFAICQQVRSRPEIAKLLMLLVSSLDDRQSRIKGLETGANDFVVKPYNPIELRSRVRSIAHLNRFGRLHEERNLFARVVELSPNGIAIVDAGGQIFFANPVARQFFGIQAGSVFSAFPVWGTSTSLLQFVLENEIKATSRDPLKIMFQLAENKSLLAEVRVLPFKWTGQPAYLLSTHDITLRKQVERKSQHFYQILEQRVQEHTAELQWANNCLAEKITERKRVEARLQSWSSGGPLVS
jgi:PAS domain S-box-containing protein